MKLITNRRILNLALLAVLLALLTSCKNNQEAERAIHVFFIGVLQIINIVIFGSTSLIFSILGFTNGKQGYRITGGILTGFFGLICLLSFANLEMEWHPKHQFIYILFILELAMLVTAVIFSVRKPAKNPSQASTQTTNQQTLDDIINEDDEIL